MRYLLFPIVTSYQATLVVLFEILSILKSFKMFLKEYLYDQTLELLVNGKQTKVDSIMLQELDPRLQEEVHTLQSLMMSCQKRTHTLKQVEDTLRNGIQQD